MAYLTLYTGNETGNIHGRLLMFIMSIYLGRNILRRAKKSLGFDSLRVRQFWKPLVA
jgi:hypothetical protein